MGPQLKMSFKIGDHQSIEVTHQNDYDSIIFEYTNEYDDAAAAEDIIKYCENDVLATEDAYNALTGDNVNHPSHYETGKFECFDVMREVLGDNVVKDFCIANTFKYIYRHKRKNGVEDIKKAKWYIDKYLELEKNKND